MTEREKMLSGELYDSSDNELEQLRLHARKLARRYNLTDEDQQEVQARHARIIACKYGSSSVAGNNSRNICACTSC